MLNAIHHENKSTLLTCDFNVNVINYNKKRGTYNFLELLFNHNFTPQITLPTRVTEKSATLIDNNFVNNPSFKYISGNITTSISDHLPQFIILENFKGSNLKRERISTTYRDFRYFNIDSFKKDLQEINWNFATENNDIDLGFETFFRLFNKTLDRYAPIKKPTKKEEKIKSKPWITKCIQKSISIRDKLYKEMIKEKNVLTKVLKHEFFKKYQNQIINLLRVSKQTHYNKYFEENKNNCRAIWIGVNQVICPKGKKKLNSPTSLIDEGKTIANPKNIAEHFNKFFIKIDTNIQNKISPTKKYYTDYLLNPSKETSLITPTTDDEISHIISGLNIRKSTGPNSLPTKAMKQIKDVISAPLAKLTNRSFHNGAFPNILKIAKVIPIFKSE